MTRRLATILALLLLLASFASGEERFTPPEFRTDYRLPRQALPPGRHAAWTYIDVAALALALGASACFVYRRRSRAGIFALTVLSIAYFGFVREGCVCSVGSLQNVAHAAMTDDQALPWSVAAFFLLPLLFTLFVGRVFCSGVCPLGAIQDAVVWKPVQVPSWLETSLGLFAYLYLGLAVLYAALGSDYVVCAYDPFVGFFRLGAPAHMLFLGLVLLVVGMFVGRAYCRFICPYGVLLRLLSPLSRRRVSITPSKCIDCRLCERSCPFGAIRVPTAAPLPPVTPRDRRWVVASAASLIVLPLVLAWVGHRAGPALARADSTVQLAALVARADRGEELETLTARQRLDAFRETADTSDALLARAQLVQQRFSVGGALVGVWMGVVTALKLFGATRRHVRPDYAADAATCLACARCFKYCPVDSAGNVNEKMLTA